MNKKAIDIFQPEIKIKHACIEKFRGFEHVELEFQDDLTVIIGNNGAGKTAVLDSIAYLLLNSFVNVIRGNVETKNPFNKLDIKHGARKAILKAGLLFGNEVLSIEGDLEARRYIRAENRKIQKISEVVSDHEHVNLPLIVYYKSIDAPLDVSDFGNDQPDFETHIFTALEGALSRNSFDFKSFFDWYKWQENIERQTGENAVIDNVRRAIYGILSDDDNEFSRLAVNWINQPGGEMIIHKGDTPLNIIQLSSGEKMVLAFAADLSRRLTLANPHGDNPLLGNGVVLIDEIDLHLHPALQRTIIPRLQKTFPNCQFIVSTHSPNVLCNVKPENIIILDHFSVIDKTPHTYGRDINSLLYELMGVTQRPAHMQKMLDRCFDLIDAGQYEEAGRCLENLTGDLGPDDPDIIHGKTLLGLMSA